MTALYPGHRAPHDPILRHLRPTDAPHMLAISQAVGWGQQLEDWQRCLNWAGRAAYCVQVGDQMAATAFAIGYGPDRAWIGGVLTHPDHQRQGHATRCMTALMDDLQARQVRHILLDATEQGRPLYEKLGFRPLYNIEVWSGRASSYLGSRARPMTHDDLPAVVALDADVFGVARGRIIRRLAADFPHRAWVDEEDGALTGFVLAQDRPELTHIGPWVARTPWSAEKLLRTALSVLIGHEVRVDIADRNTRGTAFAHGHDLRYARHCIRMIYGKADPPDQNIHQYYGMAAMATG